ncbi:hypothetical protein EUTSA_v10012008mg [Eutrema salsugineum]|uniref:BTB domain-containing protein n=1 Tax=Eutrema salsugineum TaxID=72664 RepID=V4KTZ1_EUTSA|nr:hypothetical protein EUTSA_v10012008mg [Eutrema salsugineum]
MATTQTNRETFLGGFAKILEKQWQGDLRLRAMDSDDGAYISAHKLVLAARSEVFRLMFESDEFKASAKLRDNEFKASTKLETITLSEMKHEEVEALVEFIYSDGSKLSAKGKQNVQLLFVAAHKYEIMHLRDLCRNELITSLSLTNALDVYKFSLIPNERDLEVAALAFIITNFKVIADSKELELFANNNPNLTVKIVKAVAKKVIFQY